ncbi:alpha-1-antitrypsin homolog isoform X1 [Chanos chanos]|uniref:Alpha-1-antitrypsin homolog isoform X1 n=2 Tax=Chanos chanos TaxID=29144 RepID=A0A6J2V6C7_CHACN|nr:alpha-1-antitrypsin homolog isoform X1 [Chanos chanos]
MVDNKMWDKFSFYLTFGLLLVIACAAAPASNNHGIHSADHHKHLHHAKGEPHPSHEGAHQDCHLLSPHNADFAFSLYRKLNALPDSKGKNIFFSPLSISMALSLLALGAKEQTHSEIYRVLEYSNLQPAQVNEGYEHLLHMLNHSRDAFQLEMGTSLAVRQGFKPLDKFLQDAQHYYQSEAFTADFSKPDVAAQEINKYIAKKTEDMITDLVKDVDKDTVMMLISYLFFKGKWEKPFEERDTHKADFHVDENTKVTVDMMSNDDFYDYYIDPANHTTVLMLPYKGNASMMILLPDEGKTQEVEGLLSKEQIKHWHDSLLGEMFPVTVPKFSISATYSLADTLKEMGMVSTFSETADFSSISETDQLKVSQVEHKAVLKVDERGTEAAAATTEEFGGLSGVMPRLRIDLNRPFLLLIVEDSTKTILFMGKITDPTAA